MFRSWRVMIWLCWIAVFFLPNIEAQIDSGQDVAAPDTNGNFFGGGRSRDRDGDGVDDNNDGRRFGRKGRPGFRGGRRFGKGRKGSDEAAADEEDENEPNEEEGTSATPTPTADVPATTTAAPVVESSTITQEPAPSSDPPAPIPAEPTSIAEASPEPQTTVPTIVGVPYLAPSNSVNIESLSALFGPELTPPAPVPPPPADPLTVTTSITTAITLSTTTSTTVYVTESALLLSTPIPAEQVSPTSPETTPTPSLDLAPLPASSAKSLSAGEMAGMGVGITFAVLSLAGGLTYLWYRRRTKMLQKIEIDSHTEDLVPRRGFFGPTDSRTEPKSDPEWSIESAEKVSIVRAGSVKSVASHTRPSSPLPPPVQISHLPSGPKLAGKKESMGEVVKVGLTVPDPKPDMVLAGMALRSNPPVSPSAFPSPPRANKTGSWPLPD